MNRNVNSRFAYNPSVEMSRSKMPMNHDLKTSFNVGQLIPLGTPLEVLPGDTWQMDTSFVARMQTLLNPIMDNIYLDTYFFFVPNRLVWTHWKEFCGENTESAWIPQTEYSIPQITSPAGGWNANSIASYFGIPQGVENLSVSALPFRAYAKIVDDWFRSEVVNDPLNIPLGDSTQTGTNGDSFVNDIANGGAPYIGAKYFDLFTGCTPSPQKGPDVTIEVGSFDGHVFGNGKGIGLTNGTLFGSHGINENGYQGEFGADVGSGISTSTPKLGFNKVLGVPTKEQINDLAGASYDDTGLVVEMDGLNVITINQLRQAFQIQKFYEKQAMYGSRYIEVLKSMFGVTSPDARLQRSEYLGGHRINVNIQSVSNTGSSGLAEQGAYSVTSDTHSDFTHSFTEHGYIIGLCIARYDHTYQQGINKTFLRKTKFDYYWPVFANLGNQAVKNAEIFAQGSAEKNPDTGVAYDDEVFGYQEAWYDYRYIPSLCTGEMNSAYSTSLDPWHLGDFYESLPTLSSGWLQEDKTNVDRTLAVTSEVSNQMFADFYFDTKVTRVMPLYSIPGLIDHH